MAPAIDDREKAGLGMLEQRGWGFNEGVRELDQNLWGIITETSFGAIRSRPSLGARERELICIAIPDRDRRPRVALQFKNARHVGVTGEDLKEVVPQTIPLRNPAPGAAGDGVAQANPGGRGARTPGPSGRNEVGR